MAEYIDKAKLLPKIKYREKVYGRELEGWSTDTVQTTAQMGLHRTEKIWANFEFDKQLKIE